MSSSFNPLFYLVVSTLVLFGLHAYLYRRITHYLGPASRVRPWLRVLLPAMFLLLMLMRPANLYLARNVASPIAWLCYSWLGLVLLASLVFAALQLLGLPGKAIVREPERREFFRRLAGYGGVGGSLALGGAALWQGLRPVEVKPVSVTLPKLPPALDGLRIAQISDVHIGPTLGGDWLAGLVTKINALAPDIIVITGDLSDGTWASLYGQVAPLKELRAPNGVWFITGNHEYITDWRPWIHHLPELGIRPLCNERVTLYPRGGAAALDLAGVNDFTGARAHHAADMPKALAGRDTTHPLVLLAHQPRAIFEAARLGVDLQLSGHTHDGQIWPMRYLVGLLQPYTVGLHTHPGSSTQIYVSPGTGYWGPPMRLATTAEITAITLRSPVV